MRSRILYTKPFLDSGQDHAGMTPGINVGRIPRMRRLPDQGQSRAHSPNAPLYGLFGEQSLHPERRTEP